MTPTDIRDTAIPEDVMAAAAKLANLSIQNYERNLPANAARDAIARAIMAAIEAERERCAREAREARDKIGNLLGALKRIQRLSDLCEVLPDTDGLRRAYRDIDISARVAIAKMEGRSHD